MFTPEELRFCVRFPFSNAAKGVLEKHSFDLQKTPPDVVQKAARLVLFSQKPGKKAEREKFFRERVVASSDLLLTEIQAYPIAKILVSATGQEDFSDRFSDLVAKQVFFYLTLEENSEVLFNLSNELSAAAVASRKTGFFAEVSLLDFLKAEFREDFMKLVNQKLDHGIVLLDRNDFCRFLSELAREQVAASLPVSLEHVPSGLLSVAKKLRDELSFRKKLDLNLPQNLSLDLDAFPPCMAKIFSDLNAGQNVNHPGRFNIATFLVAVGMPPDSIVDLFRKAPNFDEKVTRYQVERIAGHGKPSYSPSSCSKMREYDLCVANCPVKHPMEFYRRNHRESNSQQGTGNSQKTGPNSSESNSSGSVPTMSASNLGGDAK